jgi:hypothetical protein
MCPCNGVWIGNWIYWTPIDPWLQVITTVSLIHTLYNSLEHVLKSSQSAMSSSVFWQQLPTAGVPLPLGSRTVPGFIYQLLTSTAHKEWTPANSLTHSLTNELPFNSLTNSAHRLHFTYCPAYNISARTTQKTQFFFCCLIVVVRWHDVFHYCVRSHRYGPRRKYHSSVATYGALPSNDRCLVVCFAVAA